ncbi:Protein clt1, chloroplastic [Trifolium repens]|nr:Protein clt1, chloroplastic [Trifolium repens]
MTSFCRRLPSAGTASLSGQLRLLQPTNSAAINGIHYGYSPVHGGVSLQLRRRSWNPVVDATGHSGATERSDFSEKDEKELPHSLAEDNGGKGVNQKAKVVIAAAAVVVMGVGNRVLYKLALVPLKQYPFFLAQLATFGYVIVYFSILYIRYRAGIVTDEMLSVPKAPFLIVGLLEALGAATGMAAGAMLSGASIPILSQTFLVWQILLSSIFLGRRYKVNQLLGCFLVAIGVITTVASGSGAGKSFQEAGIFWSLLMTGSFLFQAADTVLKEIIFLDATRKLKGGSLDLFVVNSFGSAFQALFICLLLPFLSKLWGIPFSQLPNYLKDGAACFLNVGSLSSGCDGAPLLPLLFIIVNMGFNISLLHLLKISSAVVSCLATTLAVPISIYVFTLPLPYLGVASSLPAGFLAGAIILIMGLIIYTWIPSNVSSNASLTAPT